MSECQVECCTKSVSKEGHALCYRHWKAEQNGKLARCATCQRWHESTGSATSIAVCQSCKSTPPSVGETSTADYLSTTRIAEHFGVAKTKVNLILAELGWIEKYVKGWVPTDRGNA